MAKAATASKPPRTTGKARSIVWLSGLACGVLAAMVPGLAILGAGLLAPGLVALKLDHEPGRPMARTVLTCGLAACVHPVVMLWNSGHSMGTAIAIVSDPAVAGIAWGAAAAGWLMTQLAPLFVRPCWRRPLSAGSHGSERYAVGSSKPGVWIKGPASDAPPRAGSPRRAARRPGPSSPSAASQRNGPRSAAPARARYCICVTDPRAWPDCPSAGAR